MNVTSDVSALEHEGTDVWQELIGLPMLTALMVVEPL